MISVIIPTYNRVVLLERAIRSVLAQRHPCCELIIVDDGSNDTTAEMVARLSVGATVPIRYLTQENRGAAAARNLGIQTATGSLLAFLDSDDWWLPDKLGLQQAAMAAAPRYTISHTREIWYRRGQRVNQKKKHDPPHGDIFAASLRMCVVGMSTVMVRRDLFDRYGLFDEQLPCCEDYDLWLRVGRREMFLLVSHALTAKSGGRPDQLSAIHRLGMDVHRIHSLRKILASGVLDPEQRRLVQNELVRKCMIYGQGCCKHGRPDEGASYLALAAQNHPQPE
ncbi:glycosyltransferase family 2 protein [Desulfobulbus alkaliphilus]|uniref:glycosyltransferase family 2 protein n=1 Tax=Desulfobulbus alkaliphilus TaxID=869814 RepID=UPI0019641B0F|nr:glycosyltransferase family A protein [Desulfobulbus alkaliphilus]MBM9538234.1 glycosyltransferase family 2 protein [Desulfobulbus alkaliphilus]